MNTTHDERTDMTDPTTQPLTDAGLARIESHWSRYREFPDHDNAERVAEDVPDLLTEVSRLRAKVTKLLGEQYDLLSERDRLRAERDDLAAHLSVKTIIRQMISELEDELSRLRAENTALRASLDQFRTLEDRIPDDSNGERMFGWDKGWNAARSDVRERAAFALGLGQDGGGNA